MSAVAEKAGEVAAEVVEESVDGVVETLEVVRNNPVALAVVGAVCLAAGGAGGYFVAQKKLRSYYEDLATEEIAQAKQFYASLNKVDVESGDVLSPMDVLDRTDPEAAAAVRQYQGQDEAIAEAKEEQGGPWDEAQDEELLARTESKVVVTEKVETRNVFAEPAFDYEEEVRLRGRDKPYIITHDEFFAAERDYETVSLTYYEVDDTLSDEKDQPVRDVDARVGDENVTRFGTASKDKNIVYVRNEKLEIDYEIIRSTGSYLEEVLGMPEEPGELKHSDHRDRRRSFRHGDG